MGLDSLERAIRLGAPHPALRAAGSRAACPHAARRGARFGRRGGGAAPAWTPASLGSALLDWYKDGVAGANTWADSGPLGSTITKVTNAPSAGIEIDGRASLDMFSAASMEHAVGSLAPSTTAVTCYLAVRTDLVATTQILMDSNAATNRCTVQVVSSGIFRTHAGANLSSAADTLRKDTVEFFRAVFNGVSSALYLWRSGAWLSVASGTTGANTWDGLALGANNAVSSAFPGDIAESIRVSGTHNADLVGTYLAGRFPSVAKATWTARDMMVDGDSIALGTGSTGTLGFREGVRETFEPLTSDLGGTNALRFVGNVRDGCRSHSAVSGAVVANLTADVATHLTTYDPYIYVLRCGTNDAQGDDGAYAGATFEGKVDALLAAIKAAKPNLRIVVLGLTPLTNSTHNTNAIDANTRLQNAVTAAIAGGQKIVPTVVDHYSLLTAPGDLADGVHPNDGGYAKLVASTVAGIRAAYALA